MAADVATIAQLLQASQNPSQTKSGEFLYPASSSRPDFLSHFTSTTVLHEDEAKAQR
jgi:hypothetical protein